MVENFAKSVKISTVRSEVPAVRVQRAIFPVTFDRRLCRPVPDVSVLRVDRGVGGADKLLLMHDVLVVVAVVWQLVLEAQGVGDDPGAGCDQSLDLGHQYMCCSCHGPECDIPVPLLACTRPTP